MKVIYILDEFPAVSEAFILNEMFQIQKQGNSIEILAFSKGKEKKVHAQSYELKTVVYLKSALLRIISAHIYWFFRAPFKYLKIFIKSLNPEYGLFKRFIKELYVVRIIEKREPDHIHAHFGLRCADTSLLTSMLIGMPFTFTTHRYDIFDNPARNYKVKSRLAKKHITVSEYNKRYLIEKLGVAEKDISVVHCGVDFSRQFPGRITDTENIIVSIARLEKQKALENLIRACFELKKDNIKFKCLIAGEGTQRHYLEDEIRKLGLAGEMVLLGSLTQDEVFELLAGARLMVLPSNSESLPVALIEAMAMRVPVIGPKVLGVPELIEEGKCGFLISPGDVKTLVEKTKILLSDESLRALFCENGYRKVYEDYNLEKECGRLLRIWQS